jgi:hypothetical protein
MPMPFSLIRSVRSWPYSSMMLMRLAEEGSNPLFAVYL